MRLKSFIALGAVLFFAPPPAEGFLDLVINININLIIQKLSFEFKLQLQQALMAFEAKSDEEMNQIKGQIQQDFSIIQRELQGLTQQIDIGFANLDKDLKMNLMVDLVSKQLSHMHRFQTLVNTGSTSGNFIGQLNDFIGDYTRDNLEDQMVNLIDAEMPGTSSLVEALMRAAKKQAGNDTVAMKTSPNRMIYDFYMSVLFNVYRGYYFMESCVLMRDIMQKNLRLEQHEYFRTLTQESVGRALDSMKRVSLAFGSEDFYRTSYKQATIGRLGSADKFYLGISKAPEGFVITGIRFQLHNTTSNLHVLYLQIQVGQLVDHGLVNETSVHWQEPNEDIEVNYLIQSGALFYCGTVSLDDAVMTGIQLKQRTVATVQQISFVVYGHKVSDHNAGTLDDKIVRSELNTLDKLATAAFVSDDIEMQLKAPLSGLVLQQNSQSLITPQLITYAIHGFINQTDLDAIIKRPMPEFAQQKIRELIGEKQPNSGYSWTIVVLVASMVLVCAAALVVSMYRKRRGDPQESLIASSQSSYQSIDDA